MKDHKLIYALVSMQTPGEIITFTNPKSFVTHTWTVPDDGAVLFYIGETTMSLAGRWSKHKTFAKKLVQHLQGLPVKDPHDYPVYHFTREFGGPIGQNFEIVLLQDGPGLTEAEWISLSHSSGHPIQNSASGSYSTRVGGRKDDGTVASEFRKTNEAQMPRPKKIEPTFEEVEAAREAYIQARKAKL